MGGTYSAEDPDLLKVPAWENTSGGNILWARLIPFELDEELEQAGMGFRSSRGSGLAGGGGGGGAAPLLGLRPLSGSTEEALQ